MQALHVNLTKKQYYTLATRVNKPGDAPVFHAASAQRALYALELLQGVSNLVALDPTGVTFPKSAFPGAWAGDAIVLVQECGGETEVKVRIDPLDPSGDGGPAPTYADIQKNYRDITAEVRRMASLSGKAFGWKGLPCLEWRKGQADYLSIRPWEADEIIESMSQGDPEKIVLCILWLRSQSVLRVAVWDHLEKRLHAAMDRAPAELKP